MQVPLEYCSRTEALIRMENRSSTEDDGDAKKSSARASARTGDLTEAVNINEQDDSDHDRNDRDVSHGIVGDMKKLEHAPPGELMPPPGSRMVDVLERSPIVLASNHDISPGAFPVRSLRNTAMSRTFGSPLISHDATRQFTNEESKQEDGVPNSAGGSYTGAHDSSRVATENVMYTVEAQRVPDGHEEGTMMVAEAEYVRTKWYQRPVYRWILLGSILFACVSLGVVVVLVVLVIRPQSTASISSLTSPTTVPTTAAPNTPEPITATPISAPISSPISGAPPTTASITKAPATPDPTAAPKTVNPIAETPTRAPSSRRPTTSSKPTSLASERIACNFLSIPNATKCRSTVKFDAFNNGDKTTGSTIPSEIGLLSQLTSLDFYDNSLTSTIPSEIGLLSQLTWLSFFINLLTSTIPSEIGLLIELLYLHFYNNSLTSTIPSEIGLLTLLTSLVFGDNQLTSTIPSEIGHLTLLTSLDFGDNPLNSTIPSEIGLLTQLALLSFYDSSLTSTIPSEIGLLTQLTILYFYDNALKGTIPSSLCSLPLLSGSIDIDCGEVTCDCCRC